MVLAKHLFAVICDEKDAGLLKANLRDDGEWQAADKVYTLESFIQEHRDKLFEPRIGLILPEMQEENLLKENLESVIINHLLYGHNLRYFSCLDLQVEDSVTSPEIRAVEYAPDQWRLRCRVSSLMLKKLGLGKETLANRGEIQSFSHELEKILARFESPNIIPSDKDLVFINTRREFVSLPQDLADDLHLANELINFHPKKKRASLRKLLRDFVLDRSEFNHKRKEALMEKYFGVSLAADLHLELGDEAISDHSLREYLSQYSNLYHENRSIIHKIQDFAEYLEHRLQDTQVSIHTALTLDGAVDILAPSETGAINTEELTLTFSPEFVRKLMRSNDSPLQFNKLLESLEYKAKKLINSRPKN